MSAIVRILPNGGYDHAGLNWLSSYTPLQSLVVRTAANGGTSYAAFNPNTLAIETDKVNEFTAAAGVNIDGVLLKDGGATLTTALPITSGGTGAITAALARTALGLGSIATQDIASVTADFVPSTNGARALGSGSNNFLTTFTQEVVCTSDIDLKVMAHSGFNIVLRDDAGVVYCTFDTTGRILPPSRPDYTVTTYTPGRTISNSGTITLPQLADVVATMCADFISRGLFQ